MFCGQVTFGTPSDFGAAAAGDGIRKPKNDFHSRFQARFTLCGFSPLVSPFAKDGCLSARFLENPDVSSGKMRLTSSPDMEEVCMSQTSLFTFFGERNHE